MTENIETVLQQKVIEKPIIELFEELQTIKKRPICLFPTRKQCDDFNITMPTHLTSEMHEIPCIDKVDETMSTTKWTKNGVKRLQKLKSNCSLTAGLVATLSIAVGARVMLRRNIDTKIGLVNGSLGSVQAINCDYITVKFDHLDKAYHVEMVKCRFTLIQNFHIDRKQFLLILAYAITIHKCQGLSLDCAIVDLSNLIFAPGIAYVALSRVRSLAGIYLTTFNSQSVKVSINCLKEVNRLRQTYRKDLPLFSIPAFSRRSTKYKLISRDDIKVPVAKLIP